MASKSFGPTAGTADTKTQMGSTYTFPVGGTIAKIRVSGYNGVADKAGSAILTLEFSRAKGPFEYAVHIGAGLTDVYSNLTDIIEEAIAFEQGEELKVYLTASEAVEDVVVSVTWA